MAAKSHRRYHEEDGRNTALSTTEPVVSTDSSMVVATHEPQGGGGCLAPFRRRRLLHGRAAILLLMSPHACGRIVFTCIHDTFPSLPPYFYFVYPPSLSHPLPSTHSSASQSTLISSVSIHSVLSLLYNPI